MIYTATWVCDECGSEVETLIEAPSGKTYTPLCDSCSRSMRLDGTHVKASSAQRVEIGPDDVIVILFPEAADATKAARAKLQAAKVFEVPRERVLVIDGGASFAVVSRTDGAE